MPLILLGLLLAMLLLIYTIIRYIGSNRVENTKVTSDNTDVKSEYKNTCQGSNHDDSSSDDERLLMFPQDEIEKEKKKRNIH